MKKNFLWAAILLTGLAACNNQSTEQKTEPAPAAAEPEVELPMKMAYRGKKSEIGSNENMLVVMNWNRLLGEKKLDSAAALLADSVTVYMNDGTTYNTTRDSMKAVVGGFLNATKTINIQYISALPLNVDMGNNVKHEWVFNWTDEEYLYNDGKTEHIAVHEDYRLENGKIRVVYQYSRKLKPSAPEKK